MLLRKIQTFGKVRVSPLIYNKIKIKEKKHQLDYCYHQETF